MRPTRTHCQNVLPYAAAFSICLSEAAYLSARIMTSCLAGQFAARSPMLPGLSISTSRNRTSFPPCCQLASFPWGKNRLVRMFTTRNWWALGIGSRDLQPGGGKSRARNTHENLTFPSLFRRFLPADRNIPTFFSFLHNFPLSDEAFKSENESVASGAHSEIYAEKPTEQASRNA